MKSKDGVEIKTEFADKEGQIMLLKLSGFIDQSNVHLLEKTIINGMDSGCYKLIFDLGDLVYMSSAGWGILVGEIKRFRQLGGDLKIVNMNSELYEVYQMLEFYHIIDEYSSTVDAVESFGKNNRPKKRQKNGLSLSTNNKDDLIEAGQSNNSNTDLNEKKTDLGDVEKESKNKKGNSNGRKKSSKSKKKNSKASSEKDELDQQNNLPLSTAAEENITSQNEIVEKEIDFGDENLEKDVLEVDSRDDRIDFNPMIIERSVDFKKLPVTEKIRTIVARFPHFSNRKIKKVLRHEDFGKVKIGYFRLRKVLRELELDTKEKRYRYYRSC